MYIFRYLILVLGVMDAVKADLIATLPFHAHATEKAIFIDIQFPYTTPQPVRVALPYQDPTDAVAVDGEWNGERFQMNRFHEGKDLAYARFWIGNHGPVWPELQLQDKGKPVDFIKPSTKKGLNSVVDIEDAARLGCAHTVVNILITDLLSLQDNTKEWVGIDGYPVHINEQYIQSLDQTVREMTEQGMDVTGILLNPLPKTEADTKSPLYFPGTPINPKNSFYQAFNLKTKEGYRFFRGAIEYLANRYSRQDAKYGLMSGLVIGNEIQSHWVWYNMGEIEPEMAMTTYTNALRVAATAGRTHHPHYRIFASMTHHWTSPGAANHKRGISGRAFVDFLAETSQTNGDFPWSLAFHPYPENLFQPAFWRDRAAWMAMDSHLISMKNIEVLGAYLSQDRFLREGKIRSIILSEQGFHGPSGEASEKLQAAALALALEKVAKLDFIKAFHLHRHVDHPKEGGLQLGLWSNSGEGVQSMGSPKLAWMVFRDFDTSRWKAQGDRWLQVTDIEPSAPIVVPIDSIPARRPDAPGDNTIFDFVRRYTLARVENTLDLKPASFVKSAGWLAESLFMHPNETGDSSLTYSVELPAPDQKERLVLSFGIGLDHEESGGARFSLEVNGETHFTTVRKTTGYQPGEIDLTNRAGSTIEVKFLIHPMQDNDYDWAHWVEPKLVRISKSEDAGN